jgi:hypothetical protein
MNEQLEARLESYNAMKKSIKGLKNGYYIKEHDATHAFKFKKINDEYIIIREYNIRKFNTSITAKTKEEAKQVCYREMLKYALKELRVTFFGSRKPEVTQKHVFPQESGMYFVTTPGIHAYLRREEDKKRYRERRRKKNPHLRLRQAETA